MKGTDSNNDNNDNDAVENCKKIREFLQYRINIRGGSASAEILEMLFHHDSIDGNGNGNGNGDGNGDDISTTTTISPSPPLSLCEISEKISKPYPYTKKIVLELKYAGFLISESRGRYSITQKGRWFAICQKLDGVSFLSLCLLSEVYHRVKNNSEFFYLFSTFRQFYQKGYDDQNSSEIAIYHRQNVTKSLRMLRQRNLVYVVSEEFVKMTKPMIEFLGKYDEDLELLFLWCDKIYDKCMDYQIENASMGFDVDKIISKGSN